MNEAMGGGEEALVQGKLINNGKAIGFNVNIELTPVKLKGGALEGESYTMRQFHIHYGCAGEKGSEHTLDGVKFEGEVWNYLCFELNCITQKKLNANVCVSC